MKSRTQFPSLVLGLLLASPFLPAKADNLPDPATIKDVPPFTFVSARISMQLKLADFKLTGTIHSDKTHKSYPVLLLTKGHTMVYQFQDQPLQIRVQLDPGAFTLEKRSSSTASWSPVPVSELSSPVLDTDITYGDLNLDFINWDDQKPLGTDTIKTLDAYVFEATPSASDHCPFTSVRYWVSKQYWAFLRIDGINAKGQTVKRVEVQDVMTVGGGYTVFKQMKVAKMAPDKNDIAVSTTYIDIANGSAGSGLP